MKYRFVRNCHPHSKGDPVPDTFTPGVIKTMLAYGRIEPIPDAVAAPEPVEPKVFTPPADKQLRPDRVKRKGGE